MKKMFSQMFRFSFVNQTLRLAILVLGLSFTICASADSSWDASVTLTAKVNETGRGYVYVSTEDSEPASYSGNESTNKEENKNIDESKNFPYSLYAFAKPATGFYFSKWDDGTLTPRYALVGTSKKSGSGAEAKTINKIITAEFEYIIKLNKILHN